jgi:multidrug efflux pump subunit AcrA (membrane-fusion protein)
MVSAWGCDQRLVLAQIAKLHVREGDTLTVGQIIAEFE